MKNDASWKCQFLLNRERQTCFRRDHETNLNFFSDEFRQGSRSQRGWRVVTEGLMWRLKLNQNMKKYFKV